MMSVKNMFVQILIWITYLTGYFTLHVNFYTTLGQVRQEVLINNGYFQIYFTKQEYNAIVPGTIDFPGQKILEQDLYNSNEELRHSDIYIRYDNYEHNRTTKVKLIDPYSLLIKYDSSQYSYISQNQIQFSKEPLIDGMILSVRLNEPITIKTNMTYLIRGLSWIPRYQVIVVNDQSATLRALADINNEHERSYNITSSQLITGTIPLVSSSVRTPIPTDANRVEYMASSLADASLSISNEGESTNFGSYSYNVTRQFNLLPKSIKTYSFLSTTISFNYTLETTIYLSSGTNSGLFQRIFIIQPTDFLPAGIITFYLSTTGITLGQGRLLDTTKQTKQKINLGTDPDVKYQIISLITATQKTPIYSQEVNTNLTISNRKDKQIASVTLTINSNYHNTVLIIKTCSSSNININQNSINKAIIIIQAIIQPNQDETCMFILKQSN